MVWMGKDGRLTVRVGESNKAWLDGQEDLNASGLIRTILRTYRTSGDAEKAALEKRLRDKEDELTDLRHRKSDLETAIERKQREIETLQTKIKNREESVPEAVVEFAEKVRSGAFNGELSTDNPAVRTWADKASLRPGRFVEEVEVRI